MSYWIAVVSMPSRNRALHHGCGYIAIALALPVSLLLCTAQRAVVLTSTSAAGGAVPE
jgi:hypothetical protein